MKIRRWMYFIVLIGCCVPAATNAQQYRREIDSLRTIWHSPSGAIPDSTRLRAGVYLMSRYSDVFYDSIRLIGQEMDAYGIRNGKRLWRAQANCRMGKYYFYKKQSEEARNCYARALYFLDDEGDPMAVTSHLGLGRVFGDSNVADSCFYHLKYAKNLAIRYGHKQELGHVYSSLGYYTYHIRNDYINALDYLSEALKIKPPDSQLKDLIQMSSIFEMLGLNTEANDCLTNSLLITEKDSRPADRIIILSAMIKLRPPLREIDRLFQQGDTLANRYQLTYPQIKLYLAAATVYIDSLQMEKAAHCIQFVQKELTDKTIIKDEYLEVSLLQAKLNHRQGRYRQSLDPCLKILPMMEKAGLQTLLQNLYAIISQDYEALNQPAQALYFERKRENLEQILNNRQMVNAALSTYVRRITENERTALQSAKENAELLASKTKANARLFNGILGLFCFFLSVTLSIYYRSFRQKKKSAAKLEEANTQLEQEQGRLKQSNQKLRRFSGVVSHDILSNLDLILSTGHVLVGSKPRPETLSKYYEISQETSAQLKSYCLGLLEEARQTNPTNRHTPNPVLQSVYRRFEPALRAKNFRVDLENLPLIPLPPVVMEQLFQNLISNALRHASTAASPWLHIGSETNEQGRKYLVIEDNGPGIPESRAELVFQDKAQQNLNGSGQKIGLSFLKQTLQEYNADIRVVQRPGGGARFIITFGPTA